MATLESLKGSDKLREAYPKINRNFDEINQEALNLSQRLNTIITTPIDGEAAAQELVDARTSITKGKTFDTLGARLEEIEQDPGVPSGGTTGQTLTKLSDDDYDVGWANPEGGGDAEDIAYDNAESELEAENVQDAIDETVGMVKSHLADYATFKTNTNAEIVEIKKKIGIVHNIESWAEVQAIVRAGIADQVFKVGDMLVSEYNGEEVIWTIIGIDHDTPTNTEYIHSLTIQTRDCLANIQFDAPEPTNPDAGRKEYGNNRYIHSAIRQWLNSNDDVFQWVSQHEYDVAPTGAIYEGPGFLKLLDPDLAAVIGAVNKQVARNTATDGGGQDLFSDKVFLLSRVEAGLGTEGVTDGEVVYPYYDGISDAGRIKLLNGSPKIWWLRSPHVSNSHSVRVVKTDGTVSYDHARNEHGLAPACCII